MSRTRQLLSAATLVAIGVTSALVLTTPASAARPDGSGGGGQANESAVEPGRTYDRFIVHFDDGASAKRSDEAARGEIAAVERASGHGLALTRRLSTTGVLLTVNRPLDADESKRLMARFVERPSVSYVEPDVVMLPVLAPNDSSYASQWHYFEATAGMNLPTAWDTADGTGVVVAVVDTGITTHSDLAGNVVPGYDFISSSTAARDGNGRDSDAADQGDWYGAGECIGGSPFGANSSWHGTHVAGTVAALTNNAKGVSGVAFNAKVQPVRVLGKCGGTLADISDAVTWASGGTVAGVPANPTPAKVINMSLGGSGSCGAAYQTAINGAVARGTTVVVAAGNSNADASGYQPASCTSTVVVAASDRQGNRASYSNYGAIVDVTAPGGETATTANGVLSTLNAGTTTPTTEAYAYYQGTSMATPHVAGLVALMLSETALSPASVESSLKANTRPLVGTCSGGCGAGLVDATKTILSLGTTPTSSPSPSSSPSASPSPSSSPTSSPTPSPTATTAPPAQSYFENTADYPIRDRATTESPISVSRAGNAPSTLKVGVDIVHTFRGDLQIDLVAPDGSLYRLKSSSSSDSADDVLATYTVNASAEAAGGTWKLRVYDRYNGDTGYVDGWSLQF